MPTDHAEARRAAIHFIDLSDMLEFADSALLPEMSFFIREGRFGIGLLYRGFFVQRDFVVPSSFGRQKFFRKIKWNARRCFRLVLGKTFLEQFAKLGIALLQVADRVGIEREKIAVGIGFD